MTELSLPRRSERPSVLTEKMLAYQKDELIKKDKKLISLYEQWKGLIRTSREGLKTDLSEHKLCAMADDIEKGLNDMMKVYSEIRERTMPSPDTRRKMDSCEAVTKDIMKILNERITAIDGDFEADRERQRLHQLLSQQYARSIYGTASQSSVGKQSDTSSIAAKRIDAAAELAVKEAEYKIVQEEIKQRKKMKDIESGLEHLKAEKEMQAARAKLEIYDGEMNMDVDNQQIQPNNMSFSVDHQSVHEAPAPSSGLPPLMPQNNVSIHMSNHMVNNPNPQIVTQAPLTDISQLAQAIQNSIAINRIPVPMPTVFSGDPINYIEWKASFSSLVDCKGISPADKLHLLKRYVTGPAQNCLEGTFFRSDEEAYKDAWQKLDQRYGPPFIVQRAFRDKLSKWPKISSKDAKGLRTFSDFLNTCLQATPYVKGLEILSDCEENQKLLQKVPDWLAAHRNRQVTVTLMDGKNFPSFKDFAQFVAVEAEIACNPVTSSYALHSCSSSHEKRTTKDFKPNRSTQVFTTQATVQNNKARASNTKLKVPCMFCKDETHQLSKCPNFSDQPLEEKRTYVKDNKLCYGCLKVGHNAKDCCHRHTCDICKGRHPTCLHNDNHKAYERSRSSENTAPSTPNETATVTALNITKVGQSSSTSMIVPVWVSTVQSPSKEQLVYALLDTQSDSTFVCEELSKQL